MRRLGRLLILMAWARLAGEVFGWLLHRHAIHQRKART